MRPPTSLYAQPRLIDQPELDACPPGGDRLARCNYLVCSKMVQTLDGILSVASRPGRCGHATCVGSDLRLVSAQAQGIALPGSTYGYAAILGAWLIMTLPQSGRHDGGEQPQGLPGQQAESYQRIIPLQARSGHR